MSNLRLAAQAALLISDTEITGPDGSGKVVLPDEGPQV